MASRFSALVKDRSKVELKELFLPKPGPKEVLVRVALAGLCRTDIYAARGELSTKDDLILGHELAGTVEAVGASVDGLKVGARVTVNPVLACKQCKGCLSSGVCLNTGFVGIDADGGFAEFALLPQDSIMTLDNRVSFLAAAYSEPVAASLAVLKSGIKPGENGAIFGRNRFSELLQAILTIYGFPELPVIDTYLSEPNKPEPEGEFDYAIETFASSEVIAKMCRAIKPGGKLILKSRQHEPLQFKLAEFLKREPVIYVLNYGDFNQALELLSSGKLRIDNLVEGLYPLKDFEAVFEKAGFAEARKLFFDLSL
ncbi:MAG: alcohol dehydrogenase catalytic domain-containing protein [Candidatus Obscuribacterales bacterium]|nr:alcohol dehydrogenase catalytic domain-containing protein [Candidatus Obscuribacterales bacterium]